MAIYDINGNRLDGEESYPDYLVSETNSVLSDTVANCKTKTYLFAVITDSHNERDTTSKLSWNNAILAMKKINGKYPFDAVIHLGDIIHGVLPTDEAKDRIRESIANMRSVSDNVFICRGNHESNFAYDPNHYELISTNELYALTARQNETNVVRVENKLYYYVDYGEELRCVFLDGDTMGYAEGETTDDIRQNAMGQRFGYNADEINWFSTVALNTSRQVAVFCHMPATHGYITAPGSWSDSYVSQQSYDDIRAVAKNFITNGGTIVGWFYGHVHKKDKHKNANAGFTELALRNSFGSKIPNFSLIAINTTDGKVDVISFGQDANDSFTY